MKAPVSGAGSGKWLKGKYFLTTYQSHRRNSVGTLLATSEQVSLSAGSSKWCRLW